MKVGRHFGLTSFLFKKFFGNPLQKNCFATVSEERESYSKFDQSNIKSLFLELLTFQCIFWMKKDKKIALYTIYCCIKVLRAKDLVRHIYAFITTQHALELDSF